MREVLRAALEHAVAGLNERAEEARARDPLADIAFFVREDEAAGRVEVIAQYMSGHAPESAHALEDRVVFVLAGRELRDVRFERNFGLTDPETLVLTDEGVVDAFVTRVGGFLAEVLP